MSVKRQFVKLAGVCLLAALGWSLASAQSAALTINGAAFTACAGGIIEGSFSVTATDGSGDVSNSVAPLTATVYARSSGGEGVSEPGDFVAGQSQAFGFGFSGGFLYADIFITAAGATSDTYRFHCNGVIENLGGGLSGLSDGRLNRYHGDLMNVLYRGSAGGQPAVAVYSLDADSKGLLAGFFTLEDIAPYVGNPPAVNTAIRTINYATLYAITSGEFQINIGPDDENEVYTIIFDGLPATSVYYP